MKQKEKVETCVWHEQDHRDSGWWQAECGAEFLLNDGELGPKESGFEYCMFCGNSLRQRRMRK